MLKVKSKKCWASRKSRKYGRAFNKKKRNFNRQLNQLIDNALKAIAHFVAYEKNVHFSEQQSSAISMGIIAKAFKSGLDVHKMCGIASKVNKPLLEFCGRGPSASEKLTS